MPDDISTGEGSSLAAGSTADTSEGAQQSSETPQVDTAPAADAAAAPSQEQAPPPAPEKSEDEMSLTELADKKKAEADKQTETAKDEKPPAAQAEEPAKKEPKAIREAREHVASLEGQLKPLKEVESKVLEMGGLPTLEMARPLIDAALNPESTAGQIMEALAQIAPHHDAQSLAWGLVDDNKAAVVEHFCGEGMTPEILEKLVAGYQTGEIKLDDADSDADDIFLTDKEKADRARATAANDKQAADKKTEREGKAALLETERTSTLTNVGALLARSVDEAIADFKVDEKNDTPEMKDLKEVLNDAVHAMVMRELATDPVFARVQGLIKLNGFKPAEALANGSLSRKVADRAALLAKRLQPLFTGAVGEIQKQAKQIKDVREEPDGALGQGDATRKKEITAKDPNWRQALDAEFEGKIRDMKSVQVRNSRGQYA